MAALNFKQLHELSTKSTDVVFLHEVPIPVGVPGLILAHGGNGKTFLSILLAYHFLAQRPMSRAALWLTEDPESEVRKRMYAVRSWLADTGVVVTRDPELLFDDPIQFTRKDRNDIAPANQFPDIRKQFFPYDFVVIDPLINFNGGDENSNADARAFMKLFVTWAKEENKVILVLHHNAKSNDGKTVARGASDFQNAARFVYDLSYNTSTQTRSLGIIKENYGLSLHWAPKFEYRDIEVIPPAKYWRDDAPAEYRATDKVTFSYSTDTAKDFKPASRNFDKVADLMRSEFNYSAAQYTGNYRNIENALSGQTMILLDFDEGMTIEEAANLFGQTRAIIGTTRSHRIEKNGKVSDRFRVALQCKPVTLTAEEYKDMMRQVVDSFGADRACVDISRFYYGNPNADVYESAGTQLFDWEHYWAKAQAEKKRIDSEYTAYRTEYSVNGTPDSKKRGRDTFAEQYLKPGARNVTLYKIAKFAERDGVACEDIVAEVYERGLAVGMTEGEIALITREYR